MKQTHFSLIIAVITILSSSSKDKRVNDLNILSDYLIAYNVAMNQEQNDYDIWTVDPETGIRQNVTNNDDVAWTYLALSDKILFVSNRDSCSRCYFLYEMNS